MFNLYFLFTLFYPNLNINIRWSYWYFYRIFMYSAVKPYFSWLLYCAIGWLNELIILHIKQIIRINFTILNNTITPSKLYLYFYPFLLQENIINFNKVFVTCLIFWLCQIQWDKKYHSIIRITQQKYAYQILKQKHIQAEQFIGSLTFLITSDVDKKITATRS